METGEKTIALALLEQHALSVEQCEQMTTEAMEGETKLLSDTEAAYQLRLRLGLESPGSGKARSEGQHHEGSKQQDTSRQRREPRVGQRRPARDPVKGERAEHA